MEARSGPPGAGAALVSRRLSPNLTSPAREEIDGRQPGEREGKWEPSVRR